MTKNTMNLLIAAFILVASGIATWIFLPALAAPVPEIRLPATSLVVSIGPFQVNLMLLILLIAAGTPFAAAVMGLLVRWLGGLSSAPAGTTPAPATPARKATPAASVAPAAVVEEREVPLVQKLIWWVVIVIALGLLVLLIFQVLPPGFTLF